MGFEKIFNVLWCDVDLDIELIELLWICDEIVFDGFYGGFL